MVVIHVFSEFRQRSCFHTVIGVNSSSCLIGEQKATLKCLTNCVENQSSFYSHFLFSLLAVFSKSKAIADLGHVIRTLASSSEYLCAEIGFTILVVPFYILEIKFSVCGHDCTGHTYRLRY